MNLLRYLPLAGLLLMTVACAEEEPAADYQPGVHYQLINQGSAPATPRENIEVVEVFSYMCGHCNTFQPHIRNWHNNFPDQVQFNRMPVSWRNWEPFARAYYTAEAMGILDATHQPMFDALHKQHTRFRSMDDIADFYTAFDVTKEQFLSTAQSFAVDMKLRQSNKLSQDFGVTGTPTLVINGKYRISASQAVNQAQMIEVANYLIAREAESLVVPEAAEDAVAAADSGE